MEKRILKDAAAYSRNMPIEQDLLLGNELDKNKNRAENKNENKDKSIDKNQNNSQSKNKDINRDLNILAIDIGNTNIVYALFEQEDIAFTVRSATERGKTSDDMALALLGIFNMNKKDIEKVDGFAVSSVVPEACRSLLAAIERVSGKKAIIAGHDTSGLQMKVDNPRRVGADRIANAVAALWKYGHLLPAEPLVIVDLGTATTVSVLDKDGAFIGGCICPGVMTSMKALANAAAQLPSIDINSPSIYKTNKGTAKNTESVIADSAEFDSSNKNFDSINKNTDSMLKVIAKNTEDCMRAGIIYGTASMLDGIIERIEEELGESVKTIATGGLAQSVIVHCKRNIIYEPNLLLEGLYRIYMLNSQEFSNDGVQRGGRRYE